MPHTSVPEQHNSVPLGGKLSYTTLLLLVLACTFLAYVNTTGFEFVYDDWLQIVGNPQLDSWKNIPHFFLGDIWGFAVNSAQGSYYRPIFSLWLFLNYKAFGINPHWWHLTTLLLHVVMTFLVYLLGKRLLRQEPAALAAALLFGLTPLHLESVAWVGDGIDTLMGAFFLGAFLLFLRAHDNSAAISAGLSSSASVSPAVVRASRPRHPLQSSPLLGSLVLYGLALLVKETAAVFPALVFAFAWVGVDTSGANEPSSSRLKRSLRAVLPYAIVTAFYFAIRRIVLHAMASPQQHQSLAMILKTCPAVLWFYVHHLLWPFRTSEFYGLQFVETAGFMNFVFPALAVAASVGALVWWARQSRLVAFAGWWLFLPVLPAFVGLALFDENDLVHDRQLYLSSIAFCILLAFAICRIRKTHRRIAILAIIAAAFGISTAAQSRYWADDFSLYTRGVQVAPRNPLPRNYLAYVFVQKGDYTRGLKLYHEALALDPQLWRTNLNLATTYAQAGQLVDAEHFYERAIAVYPKNANQRNSSQYYNLGLTRLRMRHIADAEQPFRTALEINPSGFGYHYALGYALLKQGKLREAREQFQAELAANPDSPAKRDIAFIDTRLSGR